MSGEQKHLTIEQIERLLEVRLGEVAIPAASDSLDEARRHLADCDGCQRLISKQEECERALRSLKQEYTAQASGDCPPETRIYELVAGVIEQEGSEELVKHAAECDRCGPILRRAIDQLCSKQTDQEAAVLSSLKTSQSEWQEPFAKKLAMTLALAEPAIDPTTFTTKQKFHWHFPKTAWALTAAAAILLTVVAVAIVQRSRASYADALLARAYFEDRTLELRIPGAAQTPWDATRGSLPVSNVEKPTALLQAEALIATHLKENGSDAGWLQSKVRADLLDGNFDSAIRTAEQALDLESDTPSLLSDLGSAYFGRAASARKNEDDGETNQPHDEIDYGRAYEVLSKSLAKNPGDLVALFNRAIVAERVQLYSQAEADWNLYIREETDTAWRSEARSRLEKLQEKLRRRRNQSQMLDSPDQLAEALSSGRQDRIDHIDSIADEYLRLTVEQWLPELSSHSPSDGARRRSLRRAATQLGENLRVRHGDPWLSDFLSAASFPHGTQATNSLSMAIRANAKGDHELALQLAGDAEAEFQKDHNEPGRIRASFEMIYSSRLAAHGQQCYNDAKTAIEQAHALKYIWLETQTRLEAAACAVEISRVDESLSRAEEALDLARSSKYGNLELRATVFVAGLLQDPTRRFNSIQSGLRTFWAGSFEPMRGYSLYAVMDTSADEIQSWFWDKAAIEEGLRLIQNDPDLALRGLEEFRLARAQLAVGETNEAQRTSVEARSLLNESGSRTLNAGASIDMAEAFVMRGQYQDALTLLASAELTVSTFTQDVVLAKYYSTRAAALSGIGRKVDAEHALTPTLLLAEKGLSTISGERGRYSWMKTFEPVFRSLAYLHLRDDVDISFRWWELYKGGSLTRPLSVQDGARFSTASELMLPWIKDSSGDSTLLLSYVMFPEGIAVWAYDGTRVQGTWISGRADDTRSLVHRFYRGCSDHNSDPRTLLLQGHELYDLLIVPALGWMKGRSRLVIETDESLEPVAFEALVDKQGTYLSDSFEIEYTPRLFYLGRGTRSGQIGYASHALVVGQSLADIRDGLPTLPGALEEASEVAARFDHPSLLLDSDASLQHVVQELSRAQLFHFAGHAIANRQLSALVLPSSNSDDKPRFLDVANFNAQQLGQARLVVLSGCSTANGMGMGINDRDSLARNVIAAGVPNVVASRWPVDSLATREWMSVFYQEIISGRRPGYAAERARTAIKASKKWSHPFYWVTFSAFV